MILFLKTALDAPFTIHFKPYLYQVQICILTTNSCAFKMYKKWMKNFWLGFITIYYKGWHIRVSSKKICIRIRQPNSFLANTTNSPPYRIYRKPWIVNMSPGMACIICISEIMLLSAFKSPRIYPSSVCDKIVSAYAQHAHAIIFENYSKILNLNLNFDYKKLEFWKTV